MTVDLLFAVGQHEQLPDGLEDRVGFGFGQGNHHIERRVDGVEALEGLFGELDGGVGEGERAFLVEALDDDGAQRGGVNFVLAAGHDCADLGAVLHCLVLGWLAVLAGRWAAGMLAS